MSTSTMSTKTSREKGVYFHILNGFLAKTRSNFVGGKNDLVFLSFNQMLWNASPARRLDLGEFNFLLCTSILIPVPIWERFMAIRMQKVTLLKVFHHTAKTKFNCEKRADMFDRVLVVWMRISTVTREHKTRPHKISALIWLQSRVELSALEITLRTGGVANAWVIKACQVSLVFR